MNVEPKYEVFSPVKENYDYALAAWLGGRGLALSGWAVRAGRI